MHVPKSGGSAMRSALAQLPGCYAGPYYYDRVHFGTDDLGQAVPEPNKATIVESGRLAEVVGAHRLVIGHYAAPSLMAAGCAALAVQVREPRSRVLSLYRYWQTEPAHERPRWGAWGSDLVARADRPLGEFLRSPAVWPAVSNAISRQLLVDRTTSTARRAACLRRWAVVSGSYHRLRRSLRVVEWSQRSDAFLARICAVVGVEAVPALERENVTEPLADHQVIDQATHGLLLRLTRADSHLLERLAADGLLMRRTKQDLDLDFAGTAERLGFHLGTGN
ncbi:MAG TPA: hypothetical protein VG184_08605 [Acidimicrobiales bacterium]|nr:hypothetical protein [Acidimicrobiales bacterium]